MSRNNIAIEGRSIEEIVAELAENNHHAVKFLGALREADEEGFLGLCEALDDMNIRGIQIVVAYDVFADLNAVTLANLIRTRDQRLTDFVNEFCMDGPKAVTSGARSGQRDML